ncbi:hypothetical protein [Chryseobacterium daeguense]|uniref:hypothetical protein n=1 Tax=Chryseobacterium daeguense TaxID=412438 RepID=UPI00040CB3C4|nr:hypothetical protein [Chryseobacterium daeguense]
MIDFRRRKSEKTKLTFVNNLKKENDQNSDEGGGDYWISCTSALNNIFRTNDINLIQEKNLYLKDKIEKTLDNKTKKRFQKNIDILNNFREFDFNHIKPNTTLTFHKKPDFQALYDIHNIRIDIRPCIIFSYENKDFHEIGAVWFICKIGGLKKEELGMFCDVMYRYLRTYHSSDYKINPDYCVAIDAFNCADINYSQIINGEVPKLIDNTIVELKTFL